MTQRFSRREVLGVGLAAASAASAVYANRTSFHASGISLSEFGALARPLNQFVIDYAGSLRIPGTIVGLIDPERRAYCAEYGLSEIEAQRPVSSQQRFQIGSITKSFVAILILQLQDEGKIHVHDPIRRHLPWLAMETPLGEVAIHHLLTHTSGLPSNQPLFPFDKSVPPRQSFAPGSQFHYSNWGYRVLGRLVEHIDQRSLGAALTRRILEPLGMRDTLPIITNEGRPLITPSYVPLYQDRPYPRRGALIRAGSYEFTFGPGCIASTARDMTSYMRMLLDGGRGPRGRILSEASFQAFSSPHIPAPEFTLPPGAEFAANPSYGYGIVVEQFEGRRRIRHSGGMPSFRSTMHVDLDAGVGAFVSVNANQGYGPNPIANYANQILRARRLGAAPPPAPELDDEEWEVANPAEYSGQYLSADGRLVEIVVEGKRLALLSGGQRIPLHRVGGDAFVAADQRAAERAELDLFPFVFSREIGTIDPPETSAVVGIGFGSDWYAAKHHTSRQDMPDPSDAFAAYEGLYYPSQILWQRPTRIVARRGTLWMNGDTPLDRLTEHRFRVGDESYSPETLEFRDFVAGRAQILMLAEGPQDRIGEASER